MHPEASRLASRILTALKGESGGPDIAKLAWQFAIAVENANQRIAQCQEALANDDLITCYLIANASPKLLDTVQSLDLDEVDQWRKRCQAYDWKTPETLDLENAAKIQTRIEQIEDPKTFLYTEYRNRIRAKNPLEAYPIISLLARDYKDDPNTVEEHQRLKSQLMAQAEAELKASVEELIPAEKTNDILARYRACGLEIDESDNGLDTVLAAETEALVQEASREATETIRVVNEIKDEDDWKSAELVYLACDYFLSVTGARGKIANELREDFEKAGSVIAHKRYGSESIIRLREAIDETKRVISGGQVTASHARASSKSSLADSVERLKSAEAQTRKLGNRIPADLQQEITATLAAARRKKLPRLALLGVAAIAVLFIGFWSVSSISSSSEQAELEAQAYQAVIAAQNSNRLDESTQALSQHEEIIAAADPNSDLSRQATALRTWKDRQVTLEKEYAALADRLEQLSVNEATERNQLIAAGKAARQSLAEDLGQDTEKRFVAVVSNFERMARQREGEYRKQIEIASNQARAHLQDAAVAESKTEFRSFASKAGKSIFDADKLAQESGLPDQIEKTKKAIEDIRGEIAALEKNWSALDHTADKLAEVTTFTEYTAELNRIQGFDILPMTDKNAIERILRQETTAQTLKQQLILPGEVSGWIEFSNTDDYRRAEPQVSDVERVFLERLANDSFFETIYQSKVKYFEGAPVARSEYTAFVFDPVRKTETGVRTGVNYTFKIRGFDESGDPEPESREMNFLSHPDGTFWGFFYEPSSLSKESQYYENAIRAELLKVLSGAPRFTLVNLIDQITANRSLSPAFRAYWHQQLFSFMKMNPWKWGLALSPAMQKQSKELTRIARGEISKRLWLSTIEQSAPSLELTEYFRVASKTKLADECRAFASLYQFALQGDFEIAGHVKADGAIEKRDPAEADQDLWAINALSGLVEPLATLKQPAPYSPVVRYVFEDKPASHVVQKTQFVTGTNLGIPPYTNALPPLFHSVQ